MKLAGIIMLVRAKLHVRRTQLLVVCVVSSLLFSTLVAGITIIDGGLSSLDNVNVSIYNNKYLVSAAHFDLTNASPKKLVEPSDLYDGSSNQFPVKSLQLVQGGPGNINPSDTGGVNSLLIESPPWIVNQLAVKPYMIPGASSDTDAIPILLPYDMASKLVNIRDTYEASISQRVNNMSKILTKAKGLVFKVPISNGDTINFQIVGLLPDQAINTNANMTIGESLMSAVRTPQAGVPIIPEQEYLSSHAHELYKNQLKESDYSNPQMGEERYLVEFTNQESMQAFIKKHDCGAQSMTCTDPGRSFILSEYNTNTKLIAATHKLVTSITNPFIAVFAVVACITMMGIFARVIADSRQEIAIFRATGATKSQISLIFLVYSVIVAAFVGLMAIALGLFWALLFNMVYKEQATMVADISYGYIGKSIDINFLLMDIRALWWPVPVAIATGVISMLVTLPSITKRSIINDIKDET